MRLPALGIRKERMREQAARIGTATLTRYAEVVQQPVVRALEEVRRWTLSGVMKNIMTSLDCPPSCSPSPSMLWPRPGET